MSRWATVDEPHGVHVVPLDDLIDHRHSVACTCCPEVELVGHDCGVALHVRQLVSHRAMDGRE